MEKTPELEIELMQVRIVGDTPLIYREFNQGTCGKAIFATALGRLIHEWESGGQLTLPEENTKYEIPRECIKSAWVTALVSIGGMTRIQARQALRISEKYVEIKGSQPKPVESWVWRRVDPVDRFKRYRAEFDPWYIDFEILYNARVVTPGQLVKLLNVAGFGVGIGEGRPERDGMNGQFHVEKTALTRLENEAGQEISTS